MTAEHLIAKLNEALGWELRAINMYALCSIHSWNPQAATRTSLYLGSK